MPHSGGGGSSGGGSHGGGGSSGGSSARISDDYFPGSRRYCRHYHDGRPDEYFYSDSTPRKTGLTTIIIGLLFFGLCFSIFLPSITKNIPRKLKENYTRPNTRIMDNIGIIDNDAEVEKVFEEFNDLTGICPVVYTMYIEDYRGSFSSLENFAYHKYLDEFDDERHFLFVYAIPKDQAAEYISGELERPDFEWESMIGDDTDALYQEGHFVNDVQSGLSQGQNPGKVFANAVKNMHDRDKTLLSKNYLLSGKMIPIYVIAGIFILVIIGMGKSVFKERQFDYEEVPLQEGDGRYDDVRGYVSNQTTGNKSNIVSIIFLAPFFLIGIFVLIMGIIVKLVPLILFGLFWSAFVAVLASSMLVKDKKKDEDDDYRRYDDDD